MTSTNQKHATSEANTAEMPLSKYRWIWRGLLAIAIAFGAWQANQHLPSNNDSEPAAATVPVTNVSQSPQWKTVHKQIQHAEVGMRVPAKNPELTDEQRKELEFEIVPSQWRKISLELIKPNGTLLEMVLLRHHLWLDAQNLQANDQIELDMPELGAVGTATITNIERCPEIPDGPGQVITGTFKHTADTIYYLDIEGLDQPLGVTGEHPFWSADRSQFVAARELHRGERLHSIDGLERCVLEKVMRDGRKAVYNFEVQSEHVYYVGSEGLLVHNLYVYRVVQDLGNNTKRVAYIGLGSESRVGTALARIGKKLNKSVEELSDLGYKLEQIGNNLSKAQARGLEQRLIKMELDKGRKFTARASKNSNGIQYVNDDSTFLNKVMSYATARVKNREKNALEYQTWFEKYSGNTLEQLLINAN